MLLDLEQVEPSHFPKQDTAWGSLFGRLDDLALEVGARLAERAARGQFFTPTETARFMAGLFSQRPETLHILDAGAGFGALSAALVEAACRWQELPNEIHVTAFENDTLLCGHLEQTLRETAILARLKHISLSYQILQEDFVQAATEIIRGQVLFQPWRGSFNAAILNPPYLKIPNGSRIAASLRRAHIETTNFYAAFVWLAAHLLHPEGELVAITPRSFCNGPYFRPFRQYLTQNLSIRRLHLFDSRQHVFRRAQVLQENIILHALKRPQDATVVVSTSVGEGDDFITERELAAAQIVRPNDAEVFIHIVPDELKQELSSPLTILTTTLQDLGIQISTGRVVDFRAAEFLAQELGNGCVPLIYPHNLRDGLVKWGNGNSRKPKAILETPGTHSLLVPRGAYVLVKRFTAKEEKRRIVAAFLNPQTFEANRYAFENHLNFFHDGEAGLNAELAKGLTAYLNSTFVDEFFRQFSGHTQVNATDLRSLRYPQYKDLVALGSVIADTFPAQDEIDNLIGGILNMVDKIPLKAKKKLEQARAILKALGLPSEQQNQRAALTLLGLVNLGPSDEWQDAAAPLVGIHELLTFFSKQYGITYAENTRETVRRFTMHQFIQLGLVTKNPDNPTRAVNSPETRYQIEPTLLKLVRSFDSEDWDRNLSYFLRSTKRLARLRARERAMELMPVQFPDGTSVALASGGQNQLLKQIVEQFCPRFTPNGKILYLGDAGKKLRHFADAELAALGITLDKHGKLPDAIVHYEEKQWLVLIEAVTSHGPINLKRHNELQELFRGCKLPLVYVTAFPSRRQMVKYLAAIAWETEVWLADTPDHLIHFNGEKFLG
jgi:adenine-specific DNA-methyltransferase